MLQLLDIDSKKKIKISTITEKPPFILVTRKLPSYFYSVLTETQVSAFLLQEYRKRHGNRIIIIICLIKAIALYAGFYNSVIVAGDDLQGCKGGPAHLLYNLRPPDALWVIVWNSKGHRWRRVGYRIELRKQHHKSQLPSIFLTITRSFPNKTEDLHSKTYYNRFVWQCSLLIVTESWLHPNICLSGGTGLDFTPPELWCHNSRIIDSQCSLDLEAMSINCLPFNLPCELIIAIVTIVYIPPQC